MRTIGDLIARDLSRKIEEVIKVDQGREEAVYTELTEYVATDRIREEYRKILRAIAEAPSDPHEGVGVWISGFFGSGKSSFAKNLGFLLANRPVMGHRAGELLKAQLHDPTCANLIDNINHRLPTVVVMFDVQTDRAIGAGAGGPSISRFMYRALLRELEYSDDPIVAELEQSLEADGKLDEFVRRFEVRYGAQWATRRKLSQRLNEASAILNELDPKTYPSADSWAKAAPGTNPEISPVFLVERSFLLMERRRKGRALAYIIDEAGAYVAHQHERIEDLRAVVEQFGKESRNRVHAKRAIAPVWVMVTSQEKLDEVVDAIGNKRVELAKLQDRFKYRIDLGPADIREVASRRVLEKKAKARPLLEQLFERNEGQLSENTRLDAGRKRLGLDRKHFVELYPYPPHLIELSIDIMSGIRLQPGAPRHLGGSNRTIIKQAYEMLVSERTHLRDAPVGRLVTLDLVCDLVEGSLATERQKDLSDAAQEFGADSWECRCAKAIALLELVRDVRRTPRNLAALLHREVEGNSCVAEVEKALARLEELRFVRQTEEGYKLQTAIEKRWDDERRAKAPRPKDRFEIRNEALRELFEDPKLRTYRLKDLRSFKVGVVAEQLELLDGEIPIRLVVADAPEALSALREQAQVDSRQKSHEHEVLWTFALTPEIDGVVAELYRSRQMVQRYEMLRSQGGLPMDQTSCLDSEKQQAGRWQVRLREQLGQAVDRGYGYFQGAAREAASLGQNRLEVFRALLDRVVPDLYPKLELGVRNLNGGEAEDLLKAANLSGLPQVLYAGDNGLGLVVQQGQRLVPNPEAPIAKEILDWLRRRSEYGEQVTGKDLERQFTGVGYGWNFEVVQVALAALLRAGSIEVMHQGRRFRNHQDPLCREPFSKKLAFRSATFAPRQAVALKTLTTAAQHLEEMTGEEVDIEEAAIAHALQRVAAAEEAEVVPLHAKVAAHGLPATAPLRQYLDTLRLIRASASDDCVRMLAQEGKTLHQSMKGVRRMRDALTDGRIAELRRAREVLSQLWPELKERRQDLGPDAANLEQWLASETGFEHTAAIQEATKRLDTAYGAVYSTLHEQRDAACAAALKSLADRSEWVVLSDAERAQIAAPVRDRVCDDLRREPGAGVCLTCRSTLRQLEADIRAVAALRDQALSRLLERRPQVEGVQRVRVKDIAPAVVDSEQVLEQLIADLRTRLLAILAAGDKVILE